jgi:hypothetical protein
MPRRAAELSNSKADDPCSLWPGLRVISCWGDAHAKLGCEDLRRRFTSLYIQPKGLLATEAFVTLPFSGKTPLALRSHFFEFIEEDGACKLAHELRAGAEYELVVTTAGGLWRYSLGDRVRVTGFLGRTPCLEFIGRSRTVCDLRGEKLSEPFVASVLAQLLAETKSLSSFAMLAPENVESFPNYTLFVEGNSTMPSSTRLDELLHANPHYAHCRTLGQLAPARVHTVRSAYETFVRHELTRGKRFGEIKLCTLSRDSEWRDRFSAQATEGDAANSVQPASFAK